MLIPDVNSLFVEWRRSKHLLLNISKTKEVVVAPAPPAVWLSRLMRIAGTVVDMELGSLVSVAERRPN